MVQALHLCNGLHRHVTAKLSHTQREPFRVARVLRQPVQPFYEHRVALGAEHPPAFKFNKDDVACDREVACRAELLVIATTAALPAV